MDSLSGLTQRKLWLVLSLTMNLGLLFYFKYCNFFIDNLNPALQLFSIGGIHIAKILLPIGISFYTFESITYVVDVYRGIHKPLKNFWEYQLYIIFFPKLIAGPIVRYHDIADQITGRFLTTVYSDRWIGFNRFVIGLAKKVFIANVLGREADAIFNNENYSAISSYTAWFGALCYAMQIYFDFSGYSDMAIGIARMLGFRLPENFNRPYISKSITEFWQRWHITLGSWMRNYLYIPLGGNRKSPVRTYLNLWTVFLFSGLWHGASWSFILWGMYHGIWMVIERIGMLRPKIKLPTFFSMFFCFILVLLGWVLFRIENWNDAFCYYERMFDVGTFVVSRPNSLVYASLFVAVFISFSAALKPLKVLADTLWYEPNFKKTKPMVWLSIFSILVFVLCVSRIAGNDFNPFIYFRF